MRFNIVELDNDYRSVTSQVTMEFPSQEEADKYCKEESWTGYRYYARRLEEVSDGV